MAGIWLAARFTEAAVFPETGAAQRGSDLVVMLTNACFSRIRGKIHQRTFGFCSHFSLKEMAF